MAGRRKTKSTTTKKKECPALPNPDSAADAIKLLKDGNKRYLDAKEQLRCNDERRDQFHIGQKPWAIVLTCADSRLSPELIFDTGIGELFVVRVAGNIANACSVASIEYAVAALGVKLVVVLGHENCGAVQAALKQQAISYNLNQLLGHLLPVADEYADDWKKAKAKEKPAIELKAVEANSRNVAKELRQQSEIMGDAKNLHIVPAVYETGSGKVKFDSKRTWQ